MYVEYETPETPMDLESRAASVNFAACCSFLTHFVNNHRHKYQAESPVCSQTFFSSGAGLGGFYNEKMMIDTG